MSRQLVAAVLVVQALDLVTYLEAPHLEANPFVSELPPALVAATKALFMVAVVATAIAARRWHRRSARAFLELALIVAIVVGAFGVGTNVATLSIVNAASRSEVQPAPVAQAAAGFEQGKLDPAAGPRTAAPLGSAAPPPAAGSVGGTLSGTASWYAADGLIAAAGPDLRRWLGRGWRGSVVRVVANGRSVTVRLTDWCQCYRGERRERLIDLSDGAFAELAPLAVGILDIRIDLGPVPPATDR